MPRTGLDESKTRLLCLQSASDVEDALSLPKAMLRAHPNMTITNKMLDAHLYIFSRWVLDLLEGDTYVYILIFEHMKMNLHECVVCMGVCVCTHLCICTNALIRVHSCLDTSECCEWVSMRVLEWCVCDVQRPC